MAELKPCPFCGGEVSLVPCDDEGNLLGRYRMSGLRRDDGGHK